MKTYDKWLVNKNAIFFKNIMDIKLFLISIKYSKGLENNFKVLVLFLESIIEISKLI